MRRIFSDNCKAVELLAPQNFSEDVTATNGASKDLEFCRDGAALVHVGAIDEGSTLTLRIETSVGGNTWNAVVSDTEITAAGLYAYDLQNLGRYVRAVYSYDALGTPVDGCTVGIVALGWNRFQVPVT